MALGKKTGGRKKGTPNKTTASVKAALTEAFEGIGGVPALQDWAQENKTQFYQIWAKMLPQEVNHGSQPDNPLEVLFEQVAGTPLRPKSEE